MNSHSPQSYVSGGFKGLLMNRHSLQVIQCFPSIYHPVCVCVGGGGVIRVKLNYGYLYNNPYLPMMVYFISR